MKTFPLSTDDLQRVLDDYLMEARVDLNSHLSRAMKLVLDNAAALGARCATSWRKSDVILPAKETLVLVAYRYRIRGAAWQFEIARVERSASPEWWVKPDGECVHEFRGTFWQELVGPTPSDAGTETPGVVTEAPGVGTEPPGVGTELAKTEVPGVGTLTILASNRPVGFRGPIKVEAGIEVRP